MAPAGNYSSTDSLFSGKDPQYADLLNGEWYPHSSTDKLWNIASLVINIINVCGNIFIFYLFATDRGLREARTFLILNLAFADFMWGASAGFTELWNAIAGGFAVGPVGCATVLYMSSTGIAVSMQTLMWISVDRWLHIVHEKPSPPKVVFAMLAKIWIVAISYSAWIVFASKPAGGPILVSIHTYCDVPWFLPTPAMKGVAYFTMISYLTFLSVMAYCYSTIYSKFRYVRARIASFAIRSLSTSDAESAGRSQNDGNVSVKRDKKDSKPHGGSTIRTDSGMTSQGSELITLEQFVSSSSGLQTQPNSREARRQQRREQGEQMEREQMEERAVIFKFVTLVTVFSFSWGWWVIGVVAYETFTKQEASPLGTGAGALGSYANSALNPFLFIFLDKRFMASAKHALGLY